MSGLKFTILFGFDVIPETMHVELSAEIQMITNSKCIVTNIHRVNIAETPLLPALSLEQEDGKWLHEGRLSRISSAIGEQVENYLKTNVLNNGIITAEPKK